MIDFVQKIILGGETQWYVARGENDKLPILLFLHGGPGSPQTGAQHAYNRELEKHYVVVNWDQRGAGKSYHPNINPDTMTVRQLISDAYELVKHLLDRFQQDKLYIMGHSMGALLGLQFIHRYPELVKAYIGINQPVNRAEEELRTYQFLLKEAVERKHKKAIREIQESGPPVNGSFQSTNDLVTQRTWLTKFGGVTYKKNALWFNLKYIFSSHLNWRERTQFMKGFAFSATTMWEELNSTNLYDKVKEVKIPVYFITGKYDLIVHDTTTAYTNFLEAPFKELIIFEESGHMACFEEPELFNKLMIEKVLKH